MTWQVSINSPDHHLSPHPALSSVSLFQGLHPQPEEAPRFSRVLSWRAAGSGEEGRELFQCSLIMIIKTEWDTSGGGVGRCCKRGSEFVSSFVFLVMLLGLRQQECSCCPAISWPWSWRRMGLRLTLRSFSSLCPTTQCWWCLTKARCGRQTRWELVLMGAKDTSNSFLQLTFHEDNPLLGLWRDIPTLHQLNKWAGKMSKRERKGLQNPLYKYEQQ